MSSGWGDLWDVITGKAQAESDAADAKLAKLNQEKYERGDWTREQFDTAESHRVSGAVDAQAAVAADFKLGAAQGLDNVASGIKETVDLTGATVANFTLKAVPWWVWLILAAYVALQFGAVRRLLGKVVA